MRRTSGGPWALPDPRRTTGGWRCRTQRPQGRGATMPVSVVRRLAIAVLAIALLATICAVPTLAIAVAAPAATPTLVGIRAAHRTGYDRVVLDFRGGLPASRRVSYVKGLVGDASGKPVRIA